MKMMLRASQTMMVLYIWLVAAFMFTSAHAYQGPVGSKRPTKLSAWSMPTTSTTTPPFGSLTHTWYNEYNPTARRTVYNDSPLDYSFVTLGDDWPSAFDTAQAVNEETQRPARRRKNPLRRAVHWLFHRQS